MIDQFCRFFGALATVWTVHSANAVHSGRAAPRHGSKVYLPPPPQAGHSFGAE